MNKKLTVLEFQEEARKFSEEFREDNPAPYISTARAGRLLNLSPRQIRRIAKQGRIPGAAKPGHDWVFEEPIEVLPPERPQGWPKGTPGRLFLPKSAGPIGAIGDSITIDGDDPDFPGLRRRWRGKVAEITPEGATIQGRYWIGNASALK